MGPLGTGRLESRMKCDTPSMDNERQKQNSQSTITKIGGKELLHSPDKQPSNDHVNKAIIRNSEATQKNAAILVKTLRKPVEISISMIKHEILATVGAPHSSIHDIQLIK